MFGLRLAAPWQREPNADVTIRLAPSDDARLATLQAQLSPAQRQESFAHLLPASHQYYLHWRDLLDVFVDVQRSEIDIRELGAYGIASFRSHLLGPVLSFVLQHRGKDVWHGGAITNGELTAVILGDSGAGKSTFAAAALHSGYRVITDDLVIFDRAGSDLVVRPGPARLKLFPEPGAMFLRGDRQSIPLNPFTTKRVYALDASESHDTAARVDLIVLLKRGDYELKRVSGAEGVRVMLANVFNGLGASSERLESFLRAASAVCERCPVYALALPNDLARLPAEAATALSQVAAAH